MKIIFQITKKDHSYFLNNYFKDLIKANAAFIVIVSLLFATWDHKGDFSILRFILNLLLYPLLFAGLNYIVFYATSMWKYRRSALSTKRYFSEKTLELTETGLRITYSDPVSMVTIHMNDITRIDEDDILVILTFKNKSKLAIPKRYFSSNDEVNAFILAIGQRPVTNFMTDQKKIPYRWGYLCLIPLIGAFVGVVLIVNGIIKYKDKRLVLVGVGGIIFTVIIYSSLFIFSTDDAAKNNFRPFAQSDINNLMRNIEFYKIQNGTYPDSLSQLKIKNEMLRLDDPLQIMGHKANVQYNYKRAGNKYYLFSSGVDGIPNTADDIYPQLTTADTAKFGAILR